MVAENQLAEIYTGGEVIATGVTFEEYLEKFAGMHCELVGGMVIKMSPAGLVHNAILNYLYMLLSAYFSLKPIGRVISQPFTQRLPNVEPKREPDLLVVLNSNPNTLTETYMDGPADICIEIVSPDSVDRDRGTKFKEYELGGVPEYWILDPIHREPLFYRLNEDQLYVPYTADQNRNYSTPALPGLIFHVPTLWTDPLPNIFEITEYVKAILAE